MPFGLKNAGANFHAMINQMLANQLGRNIEAYIDDILVRMKSSLNIFPNLRETFQTAHTFGLKLNPEKCTFGVHANKFLGFMISQRGLEINPSKIAAIQNLKSPWNIKEVKWLIKRIAAINRFLSKSGEKSFPFFELLPNKKRFEWTSDCEATF